ncbi:TetR/AcrR family transcriptional regulator C-terminal domain-containing protein [Nocardia sp. alder85J]|nr:TetR/AcrR family transcriptional regulator C-terminal domain-containing protein [Nocardia sp. alder85J]
MIGSPPHLPPGTPWRTALHDWARAEFEAMSAHSWWLDIPVSTPPMGPNNMAWLNAGLAAFNGSGIPEPLKLQMVLNLSLYVMGRARFQRDTAAGTDDSAYAQVLARVLDPARFPALVRALTSRAFEDDDVDWEDADFEFCLARLLDGYERFVDEFHAGAAD